MADIATSVRAILAADATVASLVGTRIYFQQLPQQNPTYPAITYRLISDVSIFHLDGISCMARARIQVNCYSEGNSTGSRAAAFNTYNAVRKALSMYQGTSQSVVVRRIYPSGSGGSTYIEPDNASDAGMYWFFRDYHAVYVEAA